MNQYAKKTQAVTKSILGKTINISKQHSKQSDNYLICCRIVGDWERPISYIGSKLGSLC